MGQHKTNPTAIAAKNGELLPKKSKPSKRQVEAEIRAEIEKITGIDKIRKLIGGGY